MKAEPMTTASKVKRAARRKPAMLTREEERALLTAYRQTGDRRALDRLCRSFEPFIRKIAGRFARYRLPVEDLMQEGQIALIEAAGRFDTARDVRFATYAVWSVRARIQDYVLRNNSVVRMATTKERKSLFFKLKHVQAAVGQHQPDGRSVNARTAERLGVPEREVERLDAVMRRGDKALNERLPNSMDEAESRLPDERPGPEAIVMAADSRAFAERCLRTALDGLDERERTIVRRRRLADDGPTLRDLGRELGISSERTRQIEYAALGKMGDILRTVVDRPSDLFADSAVSAS